MRHSRIQREDDRVLVRAERIYLFEMFVALLLTFVGILNLHEQIGAFGAEGPPGIGEMIFLSAWTVFMCFGAMIFAFFAFSRFTVDRKGITYRFLWFKKTYAWDEIKDFGLSYSGRLQAGYVYQIYFSETELQKKNAFRKKLTWRTCRMYITDSLYEDVCGELFPFCRECTEVSPFVIEKYPFL